MKKFLNVMAVAIVMVLALACKKDDPVDETPENLVSVFSTWPSYDPGIDYDFSQDYPTYSEPTKDKYISGQNWRVDDRWFTFVAGKKANSKVTEAAVKPLLERLNTDFEYLRDEMGWVPDKLAQLGYRTTVCLYCSGLGTDDASNTETGGWQSWYGDYPVLLLSYYPVYCFDPSCTYSDKDYHIYNVPHEGIHCILSSMPGGQNASWFNEGCDVWLQAAMERRRAEAAGKNYTVELGWLTTGHVLSPFIPIECYGGWRTDGSFGGYDWNDLSGDSRYILGGVQYSSLFPSFLEITLGDGSIKYIWQNAKTSVIKCLASELGDEGAKRLVLEFRARTLLCDMGIYSDALKQLYKTYFQTKIESETSTKVDAWKATPFIETTVGEDGWLVPEERTLPGWTGANVIPVHVNGDKATVSFDPLESTDMECMICYRTTDGTPVYTEAIEKDSMTVDFTKGRPANDVIFVLVCNTNYTYSSGLRKKHYGFRVELGKGCTGTASTSLKWWDWTQKITE